MTFQCNICGADTIVRRVMREDGVAVAFCGQCGMGMVEHPPASTEAFYSDGYYGADTGDKSGYLDYAFTAEHTQLWVRLMVEALRPQGGRILDVGCASGALLASLSGSFERFGIEVNAAAADQARARGVTVVSSDINDSALAGGAWGQFDIITSIATFEHVLDLRGAVLLCLDLLATGGALVFEVPLISETADNKDWFGGSYEHIHYPTVAGMRYLFDHLPGVHWAGFESNIKGFSASYLGIATRDAAAFARAERLLQAMVQDTPAGLALDERRLNLAYHVVHSFRTTPERVLALPDLLDVVATPHLLHRLTQLWHSDAVQAANAAYHEQQVANWEAAWRQADTATKAAVANVAYHEQQAANWEAAWRQADTATKAAVANAAYHEQQAANWEAAWRQADAATKAAVANAAYHEQQAANWEAAWRQADAAVQQAGPRGADNGGNERWSIKRVLRKASSLFFRS